MATAIRSIDYEDRLSLVEHLDELRNRIIISLLALAVCFAVCFWQNKQLINIVNQPLTQQTVSSVKSGGGGALANTATAQVQLRGALQAFSTATAGQGDLAKALARERGISPGLRAQAQRSVTASAQAQLALGQAIQALPTHVDGKQPITLGVGEPLFETLKVTGYAALILALPIILWQLYGFVLPAFSPSEKKVARPLMVAIPILFIVGVLVGYFAILPPAIRFLQGFNDKNFDVLVQAKQYYSFELTVLLGVGLMFQVPVGVLGLSRMGVVSVAQLKHNRRYALVGAAVISALIPGLDPVTLIALGALLYLLFEASVQLAAIFERRDNRREAQETAAMVSRNFDDDDQDEA